MVFHNVTVQVSGNGKLFLDFSFFSLAFSTQLLNISTILINTFLFYGMLLLQTSAVYNVIIRAIFVNGKHSP